MGLYHFILGRGVTQRVTKKKKKIQLKSGFSKIQFNPSKKEKEKSAQSSVSYVVRVIQVIKSFEQAY